MPNIKSLNLPAEGRDSFDCKECYSSEFIQQKLKYIPACPPVPLRMGITKAGRHQNAVKAGLVIQSEDYKHCSARFYKTEKQGIFPVEHYLKYYDPEFRDRLCPLQSNNAGSRNQTHKSIAGNLLELTWKHGGKE